MPDRERAVRVAFHADRELCAQLGLTELAKRRWSLLHADERAAWLERGPSEPERQALYRAILAARGIQ